MTKENCMAALLACALLVASSGAAADLLQHEMDAETLERTGLSKLSEAELEALNDYLGRVELPQESRFGAEQVQEDRIAAPDVDRINARVKGAFTGWEGRTVFRLDNGQIWQQRIAARYRHRASDPAVTITRDRFGYYLTVDETGRKVGVKRLK